MISFCGPCRTPTFSLSVGAATVDGAAPKLGYGGGKGATSLVDHLNSSGVYCTHGNHYAPGLYDGEACPQEGTTRVSFLHYNSLEDVDKVLAAIHRYFD